MLFEMNGEMIAAGEGALTVVALERPISGVFAVMSRQFVRPCEPPIAARPGARVRPFSRVSSHVDAQMRQLGVVFSAADVRTDVLRRRTVGCPSSSTDGCPS